MVLLVLLLCSHREVWCCPCCSCVAIEKYGVARVVSRAFLLIEGCGARDYCSCCSCVAIKKYGVGQGVNYPLVNFEL